MKKIQKYLYLGNNGTLLTPIQFDGVPSVKKIHLIAEDECALTKDGVHFYNEMLISEDEISLWYEVPVKGQV